MDEKYTIEIEGKGEYETRKSFKHVANLSDRQFLALTAVILDYLDTLTPTV